ncbi:Uncharacterised protein (plasmid) [Mesomycoplasma conjunctivae]|nr:hypothetical protein [Mycoplasmopsis fermentans]VEU64154.1 Uncharacterised protein [Mycoplasmopsis fermentans]VEU67590.1 Uncharacterised protein [Mesomycoplasma conjunctivae]
MNTVIFWIFSIFAIVGSLLAIVAYIGATIDGIVNNDKALGSVFYGKDISISKWVELGLYLGFWVLVIVAPIINYYLIKAIEKWYVLEEFDLENYQSKYVEDLWSNCNFNDSHEVIRVLEKEPENNLQEQKSE